MKTGDIIFFKTNFCWYKPASWLSTAIRLIANIEYNHVGLIILIWDRIFVLEALGKGIILTPYEKRINNKKIKITRPYREINEKEYATEAMSYLSTKYDYAGLLFHQLIYMITKKWIGGSENKEIKRFYCYEFVAFMNKKDYPNWHKVNSLEILYADWHELIYKN